MIWVNQLDNVKRIKAYIDDDMGELDKASFFGPVTFGNPASCLVFSTAASFLISSILFPERN